MIKYLKHKEINKEKWDQCISASQNKVIYALSWYLDVVSPNWDGLIKDDYEAVMPISHKKKYGIKYVYQPFFSQQLGIFSMHEITGDFCKDFIDAIPHNFYEINLNTENPTDTLTNHKVIHHINYELDLSKSYKDIYASYSENHKRNIKKAAKNNLKIVKDIHENILIEIFRRNKGKNIKSTGLVFYEKLYDIIKTTKEKKSLQIYAVSHKDKLIAGAFFLEKFERAIFIFSATTKEAKEFGAMAFLIDEYIKDHIEKISILDFEGSNDIGIAKFYAGFGSKKLSYPFLRYNQLKNPIKLIVNIIKPSKN